jgi:hypothetical protein
MRWRPFDSSNRLRPVMHRIHSQELIVKTLHTDGQLQHLLRAETVLSKVLG